MWAAQLLTLSRIPLALVFWIAVADARWAFATMAVAALTDVADGAVEHGTRRAAARGVTSGQAPAHGSIRCATKTFVLSDEANLTSMSAISVFAGAIALREIILVPLAAIYRLTPLLRARMRYDFKAGPLGKAATVAQFLAIAAILLRHPSQVPLALLAGAIGLAAAVHYVRRGVWLARAAHA